LASDYIETQYLRKEGCDVCGSSDGKAVYDDGHTFCFVCPNEQAWKKGTMQHGNDTGNGTTHSTSDARMDTVRSVQGLKLEGEVTALASRKIHEETCKHWGYRVGEYNGRPAQFAYYYDCETRQPVACKVRFAPNAAGKKDFTFLGDPSAAPLYGQWLFKDGGKKVIITEGEIDALTVSQLQQLRWPVVSIQNGANGAVKSIKKALDWLEKFDEVVFMFDQDDPGIAAAKACAELLTPGKAKIASLPLKDASDCLKAGRGADVVSAMWNAVTFRPDGIIDGTGMWDILLNQTVVDAVEYPWPTLNTLTHGLRTGELVTVTAGSGIGKSAFVREIAYSLIQRGETVGMIMLEEDTKRTALGLMGLAIDKPLHLSREGVTVDALKTAFDNTMGTGRVFLYDHFGSTDVDNLLNKVRYMAKSLDCRYVIIDHLSIVVSGLDDGGDERKLIDRAMTMLRTLVQETGIGLILVSHLKRPEGKGHEDGAQTSLSQLRGSAAIGQLSDMVIGIERNQQGENPNANTIRLLKNRFSGETGIGATLFFDKVTGRLTEFEGEKIQEHSEF